MSARICGLDVRGFGRSPLSTSDVQQARPRQYYVPPSAPSERCAECPICMCSFESEGDQLPYVLQCAHTVCRHCTELMRQDGEIVCPTCQHVSTAPPLPNYCLRDALLVMSLRPQRQFNTSSAAQCEECNDVRASVFCEACQAAFCDRCMDASHGTKVLRRHIRHQITPDLLLNDLCPEHGLKLDMVCVDCDTQSCNVPAQACCECAHAGIHKGHHLKSRAEVIGAYREQLHESIVAAVAAEAEAIEASRALEARVQFIVGEGDEGCAGPRDSGGGILAANTRQLSEAFGRLQGQLSARHDQLLLGVKLWTDAEVTNANNGLHSLGLYRSRLFAQMQNAEAASQGDSLASCKQCLCALQLATKQPEVDTVSCNQELLLDECELVARIADFGVLTEKPVVT